MMKKKCSLAVAFWKLNWKIEEDDLWSCINHLLMYVLNQRVMIIVGTYSVQIFLGLQMLVNWRKSIVFQNVERKISRVGLCWYLFHC